LLPAGKDGQEKQQRAKPVKQRVHDERRDETAGPLIEGPEAHRQEKNRDRGRPLRRVQESEQDRSQEDGQGARRLLQRWIVIIAARGDLLPVDLLVKVVRIARVVKSRLRNLPLAAGIPDHHRIPIARVGSIAVEFISFLHSGCSIPIEEAGQPALHHPSEHQLLGRRGQDEGRDPC
jgi:hypothetical protein